MLAGSRPIVYIQTAALVRHLLQRQKQMIESKGIHKVIVMSLNHHNERKQDGCVLEKISNGTMLN